MISLEPLSNETPPPSVEEYLRACATFSNASSFFSTFDAEMREDEVAKARRGLRALREFAERIAAEDAAARHLLGGILDSPYRFTYANILDKKRFYTGGVARRLCEAAQQCDVDPLYARQIIEA